MTQKTPPPRKLSSGSHGTKRAVTLQPPARPGKPSPLGSFPPSMQTPAPSPPRKPRQPLRPEQRENIRQGAKNAVKNGTWSSPAGPLWTPAEDAQLGTAPDSAIAARLGRSVGSVGARRHKLRIPAATPRGRPPGCHSPWHPALKKPAILRHPVKSTQPPNKNP